jgi:hypothetical protein
MKCLLQTFFEENQVWMFHLMTLIESVENALHDLTHEESHEIMTDKKIMKFHDRHEIMRNHDIHENHAIHELTFKNIISLFFYLAI